ncbi:MAG: hypothetical protein EOO94_00105 [Pedobacter sp.]|nr:MAG: hypothetical protein EOO94_00105 [Pedobacter sp.]
MSSTTVYSPSKRVKNLVYYEDRVAELQSSPGLVMQSQGQVTVKVEVKVEEKEGIMGERLEL